MASRCVATCGATHAKPHVPGQVTPSSKVVGDLAQFMVQNNLDEHKLVEKAESLSLPSRCPQQPSPTLA